LDYTPCLRDSEHNPTLSLTGWLIGIHGRRHHPLLFPCPRSRKIRRVNMGLSP